MPNPEGVVAETHKVSVKFPPFWIEKAEIWFYQIEAQFKISGITTEETKFNYLVSQLEPKFVENIWDIVSDSSDNKYSAAKERLLNTFKESENKRIKRLVTGIELGDMKPSQLLQKMRSLATDDISDKVIKTLWLDKLPDSIKNILIVSEEALTQLAVMADKIAEMNPKLQLYSASSNTNSFEEVLTKISNLEQQIEKLNFSRQSRPRNQNFSQNRSGSRSRSRKRFDPKGKFCFYHFRFGAKCFPEKCTPPCSWKVPENFNQQQN